MSPPSWSLSLTRARVRELITNESPANRQIEHHLFPRISHVHYHKLAPIVKEWCKEHKLRYAYYPTLYSNVVSCAKYLHHLGNDKATMQVG